MRSMMLVTVGAILLVFGFYRVIQKEFGPSTTAEQQSYCEGLLHEAYSGDASQIATARVLCDSAEGIRAAERMAGVTTSAIAQPEQPTRRRRLPLADWINYVMIGIGAGAVGLGLRSLVERGKSAPPA